MNHNLAYDYLMDRKKATLINVPLITTAHLVAMVTVTMPIRNTNLDNELQRYTPHPIFLFRKSLAALLYL